MIAQAPHNWAVSVSRTHLWNETEARLLTFNWSASNVCTLKFELLFHYYEKISNCLLQLSTIKGGLDDKKNLELWVFYDIVPSTLSIFLWQYFMNKGAEVCDLASI